MKEVIGQWTKRWGVGNAWDRCSREASRSSQRIAPLPRSLSPRRPLPAPLKRRGIRIPPPHDCRQPLHHLLCARRMLSVQGSPHQDPLHRLGQVQPRPTQRRVERHHPLLQAPTHHSLGVMPRQVVPDQRQPYHCWLLLSQIPCHPLVVPAPLRKPTSWRLQVKDLGQCLQQLAQLHRKPWVEHNVRALLHRLGDHLAGLGSKQRQQLGRSSPDVLVGLQRRLAHLLPRMARLWNGLVGSGLILAPNGYAPGLPTPIRLLDHPFFCWAWGSLTVTLPALRFRTTLPVSHQVRLSCQVYPASWSACQIVAVLTLGNPYGARRNARCSVFKDHTAVPSFSRSGVRENSFSNAFPLGRPVLNGRPTRRPTLQGTQTLGVEPRYQCGHRLA